MLARGLEASHAARHVGVRVGGSVGEREGVDARVSVSERGLSRRLSRGGGRAWMWGVVWVRERVSVRERTQPYASHQGYATCRLLLLSAGCHRCAPVLVYVCVWYAE